jgi:carbon monoxide dehydrogenase subunit G
MELTGEHTFAAPRQQVWDLLLDPETLRSCLPGCERLEPVGPDEFEATMKIGVAAIRGTYQGKVKISEQNAPESYKMLIEGKGPAGQVSGEGSLVLVENGNDTTVQYAGKANVRGTLARVGARVMQPAAKLVVGQFFTCLSSRLEGQATATE